MWVKVENKSPLKMTNVNEVTQVTVKPSIGSLSPGVYIGNSEAKHTEHVYHVLTTLERASLTLKD